ncbi:MAG: hypothetical protein NZ988_05115 [Thaumarchaeota archaeon]|nr:hypothetical protein [Candidatus Calditenuaceae archaeon]MDW8187406.1 hypothetical protein [Nitrososphaerota archaeon]
MKQGSDMMSMMYRNNIQNDVPLFINIVEECIQSFEWTARSLGPILLPPDEEREDLHQLTDIKIRDVVELGPGVPRRLAAVDASVIKLGLWGSGVLISLKGAVVRRSDDTLEVTVFGPVPKYVPLDGLDEAGGESAVLRELKWFERSLQVYAALHTDGEILLFDSLLTKVEREVHEVSSYKDVIGVTKSSLLALKLKGLQGQPTRGKCVALVVREDQPIVTLSKLSADGLLLRVDVWSNRNWREALNDLLSSDVLISGYPETLTLAHAYSKQSWSEISVIRSLLMRMLGVEAVQAPNVRAAVLSPFDGT